MKTIIGKGTLADIDAVKILADSHRSELGFVMRPSLVDSVDRSELIIAYGDDKALVGFVQYRHLKTASSTIYHICVEPSRRKQGIGSALIATLAYEGRAKGKNTLRAKCPQDLPANEFYRQCGFILLDVEVGKHRALNVWALDVT